MAKDSPVSGFVRTGLLCAALMAPGVAAAQSTDTQDEDVPESAVADEIEVESLVESPAPDDELAEVGEAPVTLENITVIGDKLGRTLDESATSVSLTSGVTIEDYGLDTINDILDRSANAIPVAEGGLSIRGVSDQGADSFGLGQPVITAFLDGVAVDKTGQQSNAFDVFDVDQVEVLRGPQSTSQGRNVLAGAIIITTRDPTQYWEGRGQLRADNLGGYEYAFAGGGPLGRSLSFRVAADLQGTDGDITNATRNDDEWGARDTSLFRGKLRWTPSFLPDLNVVFSAQRTEAEQQRELILIPVDGGQERTALDNDPGGSDLGSDTYSMRAEYMISPYLTFTAITGFIDSRWDFLIDYDQTEEDNGTGEGFEAGRNLTQELRLNVDGLGDWTGVFGLYAGRFESSGLYLTDDLYIAGEELIPVVGQALYILVDTISDYGQEAQNIAAFAEFDYAWTDRLTLTFGLRYDYEERSAYQLFDATDADAYAGGTAGPGTDVTPLASALFGSGGLQETEASYDAWLPKVGLRFAPWENLTLFATYQQAYRAGGVDIIATTGELNEYDPETTYNYELGFRASVPSWRLSFGVNTYYVDWRDQQVNILTPDGLSSYTENAATSTLYGAEAEINWALSRAWSFFASLGYASTSFDEYVTTNGDYTGNEFVMAPNYSGSLGGRWRSDSGWFSSASVSHSAAYYSQPDNAETSRVGERTLVNARVGYEHNHFSVYLFGRNLTDEDYQTYRYLRPQGYGYPYDGYLTGYGEPRVYGVQLNVNF